MTRRFRNFPGMGEISVVISGILWGVIGLFIRRLDAVGLAPVDIAFFRSAGACAIFGIILLIFNRPAFRIRLSDVWCFLGTGVASIAFFNLCYFSAMKTTTLAVAAILLYTSPVFVLILSAILFREKFTVRKAVSAILVLLGCALVSGIFGGVSLTLSSFLFGIGAGFGYALYSIFGRFAISRGYHTATINFYSFLFATIAFVPFTNFRAVSDCARGDTRVILWLILLSIISTLLPYLFYTLGLTMVENGVAAILASVEPVVAALVGVIFLGDPLPDAISFVGMLCVLLAIILPNIPFARKEKRNE